MNHADTGDMSSADAARLRSPQMLAEEWLRGYARASQPLWLRAFGWLPLPVAVLGMFLRLPFAALLGFWATWATVLLAFGVWHAARVRFLLGPLGELAAFPDATEERHLRVVAEVLIAAGPRLRGQRTPAAAGTLLRDAALRLFVAADLRGCAQGHSPVCQHRRDADAWLRWLDPDTGETPDESARP